MIEQEALFYYFDDPEFSKNYLQVLIDAGFKIICFQTVYCPEKSWAFYMTVVIEKNLSNE